MGAIALIITIAAIGHCFLFTSDKTFYGGKYGE